MASNEAIEQARAKLRASKETAKADQEAKDNDAFLALLESGKYSELHRLFPSVWEPGTATYSVYRACSKPEFKRYTAMSMGGKPESRSKHVVDACDQLGATVMLYPAENTPEREAFTEAYPGVFGHIAIAVIKLAELEKEDEGKD